MCCSSGSYSESAWEAPLNMLCPVCTRPLLPTRDPKNKGRPLKKGAHTETSTAGIAFPCRLRQSGNVWSLRGAPWAEHFHWPVLPMYCRVRYSSIFLSLARSRNRDCAYHGHTHTQVCRARPRCESTLFVWVAMGRATATAAADLHHREGRCKEACRIAAVPTG